MTFGSKNLWKRIFGFKEGDRVRVITVSNRAIPEGVKKAILGKEGEVVRETIRYLDKDGYLCLRRLFNWEKEMLCYLVKLAGWQARFLLLVEDLERVD